MPPLKTDAPARSPSPFDEVFETEEIIRDKHAGPIGNPYEAKPTAAMMALLRGNGTPGAEAAAPDTDDSASATSALEL
ncbi:MAG TPA: hypothetical protein DEB30_05470 [Candidatus Peribacter riflensis]|uniref:Uncharacterized protein n=1 Tax=Candidatus Peribacter riflensis TaxID=1735162 RepID=A0A0S1SNA8_9BACT|nr:MAG: hypothetical protein PeribacterA2_0102 [Candidatus Peribacter riflensis]OGJ76681.1 MAG: hypothetical protein A2398_03550 [Candidatus Peribacteria bacterium RIFOXYB1_FULL_57_12]OGJ78764.1 MAG: hypothetical protein A2412_02265 [Candidatus Peribacteria bacterium RIFOXYC1_FULL_58_8]ALM10600.1 MAG: hypothetical protein PeribacterB2_0102 [Candidatus Peribacter riflensis]ALM11702.1 MAG: hypothetical protein PeribacterC2_0101 [Candidatus Peribacter riflensis]